MCRQGTPSKTQSSGYRSQQVTRREIRGPSGVRKETVPQTHSAMDRCRQQAYSGGKPRHGLRRVRTQRIFLGGTVGRKGGSFAGVGAGFRRHIRYSSLMPSEISRTPGRSGPAPTRRMGRARGWAQSSTGFRRGLREERRRVPCQLAALQRHRGPDLAAAVLTM